MLFKQNKINQFYDNICLKKKRMRIYIVLLKITKKYLKLLFNNKKNKIKK